MRIFSFIFSFIAFISCVSPIDKSLNQVMIKYRDSSVVVTISSTEKKSITFGDVLRIGSSTYCFDSSGNLFFEGLSCSSLNLGDVEVDIIESSISGAVIRLTVGGRTVTVIHNVSSKTLDSIAAYYRYELVSDILIISNLASIGSYSSSFLGYLSPQVVYISSGDGTSESYSDVITFLIEIGADIETVRIGLDKMIFGALL
jgi:hypothetical protein